MKQTRTSSIDVARGIGILLVVYGHSLSADSLRFIIYSFHMPLFFFLSGLVFTYRPEQKVLSFLQKNIRGLLYPYFIFAFLSFALWIMTKQVSPHEQLRQFWSIFYGNGNNNLLAFNNLLWFLPCLFVTRLGFFSIAKITVKKEHLLIILFLFSVIGYCFSLLYPKEKLFLGIETALTAIVFFGAGYLWKTGGEKLKEIIHKHSFLIFLAAIGTCILFAALNFQEYGTQIDLRQNRLNNYVYFYLASFAGTISMLIVSIMINKNIVLEYVGRKSLVIFVWHLIVFSYIAKFLSLTHLNTILSVFPDFISPIFYSILSIIIILVITYILKELFTSVKKAFSHFNT